MKAIIFNSGLGKRLGNYTSEKPKCMLKLYNGETILERQIRILSKYGIHEFIITVGPYKEQLYEVAKQFHNLRFHFVENRDYENTNYIVSMNLAYDFLDEDMLLLHGDLVFNEKLVKKVMEDERKSLCLYDEERKLPEKDFKARFTEGKLEMVSVSIFEDCYAFQPFYKLSKQDILIWKEKVAEFVSKKITNVYAENALNEVTSSMLIEGFSYKNDYIDEIDNEEDYFRVSKEIMAFDRREQEILFVSNYKDALEKDSKLFVVCSQRSQQVLLDVVTERNVTFFCDYSPNPKYEEIQKGVQLFKQGEYDTILSFGGGSTMDVAKCIKVFSSFQNEEDFFHRNYQYNRIRHIAVPTTAGTGSESTQIAVIYVKGEKFSVDHPSLLPDKVILDGTLLNTLPDYHRKSALLDALCQAIESYWSKGATQESKAYSKLCIEMILNHYEMFLQHQGCNQEILLAANYSGRAINISRTTAAHSMSYKLTTLYGISHGHAVGICMVPIWKMLSEKVCGNNELMHILNEISHIFGTNSVKECIMKFEKIIDNCNMPKVNIDSKDIEILVHSVDMQRMGNNPIVFNEEEIEKLYSSLEE